MSFKVKSAHFSGISVVVPVYNSASTLARLAQEIVTAIEDSCDIFEIVLVNDASRDMSWQIMSELASSYNFVRIIDLSRNYGQHNALLCGIRAARYPVTITLDDDLQNPPSEIAKLLNKLSEGFDVVYGVRENEAHGLIRNLASVVTKLVLQQSMGAEIARNITSFRAFRTCLRNSFASYSSPYVCVDILLSWATCRFSAVTVSHLARQEGLSNYTFGRLITHASNMLTGFSILPLQLASICGFTFLLFGILALCYVLTSYLLNHGSPVPGFAFLACIIIVFAAAQLLAIGIIGEYLARMYARTMGKPAYIIRENSSSINSTAINTTAKIVASESP